MRIFGEKKTDVKMHTFKKEKNSRFNMILSQLLLVIKKKSLYLSVCVNFSVPKDK